MNSGVSYNRPINLSTTDRYGRAARISNFVALEIPPVRSSSPCDSVAGTGSGSGGLDLSSKESFKPAIY